LLKVCSSCSKEKEHQDFYKNGKSIESKCKECKRKLRNQKYKHAKRKSTNKFKVSIYTNKKMSESERINKLNRVKHIISNEIINILSKE
jgi:hypothetical protein